MSEPRLSDLDGLIARLVVRRDGLLADYALATKYEHNSALVPRIEAELRELDAMLAALKRLRAVEALPTNEWRKTASYQWPADRLDRALGRED